MMDPGLKTAIETALRDAAGTGAEINASRRVGGGCINEAATIGLSNGATYFVKSNPDVDQTFFACEAEGLRALAATGTIRIPEVVALGNSGDRQFLILEQIETGKPDAAFMTRLGSGIAQLHNASNESSSRGFGFASDNYIGASPQPNAWTIGWAEFWAEQRIGFQLKLAKDNRIGNTQLFQFGERLLGRLDSLIGGSHEAAPSLIHGDLWSGNFLCDSNGNPVLIDPAVYYADAEAEFGMTTLFGGFSEDFYSAYNELLPSRDGAGVRIAIYRLYHSLNHLNLFGSSYLGGCLEILQRFA